MAADPTFLYPNVSRIPGHGGSEAASDLKNRKQEGAKSEFDHALTQEIGKAESHKDLSHVKQPLKFSAHASQRLQDRKIALDPKTLAKVSEAVDKAEQKGLEDTLVLTNDAALIVNVKNRTVITAIDKASMNGNVFTNIDGAVIV